jgi:hydroxyacylglutathione hydrolase
LLTIQYRSSLTNQKKALQTYFFQFLLLVIRNSRVNYSIKFVLKDWIGFRDFSLSEFFPLFEFLKIEKHYITAISFQSLSSLKIQEYSVGMLLTNCYIVSCPRTKEAIIVDPGFDDAHEAEQIFRYVDERALKIMFVVNTHGHSDHTVGDKTLEGKYGMPICIHPFDAHCLDNLALNLESDIFLLEEETPLEFGRVALKVMHTPGHTTGSVSLVGDNVVFTGDTLFSGGIGRTDFPEGSYGDIQSSLRKLMCLPDGYVLYPGHGGFSTIGDERRLNPFLRWL